MLMSKNVNNDVSKDSPIRWTESKLFNLISIRDAARRKAAEEKRKKPFQHVYITCPDGQHVQYLNDEFYPSKSDMGGVVVRQSYPVKPSGAAREKPAAEETSRTVMTDGTVIKVKCVLDGASLWFTFLFCKPMLRTVLS